VSDENNRGMPKHICSLLFAALYERFGWQKNVEVKEPQEKCVTGWVHVLVEFDESTLEIYLS
jgi:hypothetical protein